jgi:uncharacterized protein (TIGR02996 family)
MTQLDGLLDAIVGDPPAEDRRLVLADWLGEHDDALGAEMQQHAPEGLVLVAGRGVQGWT